MVSPPPAWRLYNACCIVATLVARRSRSLQTAVLKLALRPIDDELHHQVTAPHTIHAWPTHAHQAKAVAVAATGRDRYRDVVGMTVRLVVRERAGCAHLGLDRRDRDAVVRVVPVTRHRHVTQ